MPANNAPRLRAVLVDGIILHTADGDEHHLLKNLHSHAAASETPGQTSGRVARQPLAKGGRDLRLGVVQEETDRQQEEVRGERERRRITEQQRRGGRD